MEQPVFNSDEYLSIRAVQFSAKDLGQLHKILPLEELAGLLPVPKKVGTKGWFDNKGKIAYSF